jgi:hypothetical protein
VAKIRGPNATKPSAFYISATQRGYRERDTKLHAKQADSAILGKERLSEIAPAEAGKGETPTVPEGGHMVEIRRPSWLARQRLLGLKANDLDLGVSFPTISDAEANARVLLSRGYRRVEIFDRATETPSKNPNAGSATEPKSGSGSRAAGIPPTPSSLRVLDNLGRENIAAVLAGCLDLGNAIPFPGLPLLVVGQFFALALHDRDMTPASPRIQGVRLPDSHAYRSKLRGVAA